jgi:tetratricopeptide (TPR) repeat protein
MSNAPLSAADHCERALAMLIADGAAAARLVAEVLLQTWATATERALAHGVAALHELREGTVAEGMRHLEAGEALIACAALSTREANLLQHARTQCLRRQGRLAVAKALLQTLHQRAEHRPVVDAYYTASALGTVLSMQGDDDGSLDLFYQALALARRSGELSLVVNALNNLGSYQTDLYNLEDAGPLLEECLAGAVQLRSRRQTIYAAGNLMQCLCLMGHAERALVLAREYLIGHIRPDDPPALHRDEEIAQTLLDNGLEDEAEFTLGGEARVDPLSNEMATARVWMGARILLARGRAGEALALCLARRAMLEQQGEEGTAAIDRVNLLRLAAQAAHQVGDPALAYQLLEQAFAKHEQLLGRSTRSSVVFES